MSYKKRGIIYIIPWLFGFVVFTIYPFITSLILSFTDYKIIYQPKFIGLSNYINMLKDNIFWTSLFATFKFVLLTVPFKLIFALVVAMILNFKLRGINFYRTAYYIPSILGGNIAVSILWKLIFQDKGIINQILNNFGFHSLPWFSNEYASLLMLSLLRIWQFGSAMVIFLAALKDIPLELYEAAWIDGASKIKAFMHVTIPLLTPIIFFNLVMQLIQSFQEFNGPYMITEGGPQYKTYLYSLMIYDNGFKYFNMGYASALSWIFFLIVMLFTLLIFKFSKYWVFYSDEGGEN
ncbi:sugar ABC transporter permease [Thermoanaerobacterium thermosaccharolyticum]|uniref:carbohydrate ABC transporter permease n=1 Tax=Thermoanaerobacterium thermosaccharolyticum TaxID=1517 RepID=UPI000C06E3DE|nr:sugar ABC transporter permease [Thermoanaerobacterium thermosaccharolyticum]PHO08103.1 sugar ABC transporter permease [Thermoanaerobacterium thermosaccharolyticum]